MQRVKSKAGKPSISIVGPGRLGSALGLSLHKLGYPIRQIVSRPGSKRSGGARRLAKRCKAQHVVLGAAPLDSELVWIAVQDDVIAEVAQQLAGAQKWRGKTIFHSSGALSSDELAPLWEQGAAVGSLHPMMTFATGKPPSWRGVAFTFEGDEEALPGAREVVGDLGGELFRIEKRNKVLYHAFASFASPLVIALLATMEQVAEEAGLEKPAAKRMMLPLLWQTLNNYLTGNAESAFTGPIARGDVATVRRHVEQLRRVPTARDAYVALAWAATELLPATNIGQLREVLEPGQRHSDKASPVRTERIVHPSRRKAGSR